MKKSDFKPLIDTPFGHTLSLISGKWKMVILYLLDEHTVIRYNELQRKIGSITYKMLSSQLKELEASKLINRKEYPSIPPKVEYSLTKKGKTLIPILDEMCKWGSKERPDLVKYIEESDLIQEANSCIK